MGKTMIQRILERLIEENKKEGVRLTQDNITLGEMYNHGSFFIYEISKNKKRVKIKKDVQGKATFKKEWYSWDGEGFCRGGKYLHTDGIY